MQCSAARLAYPLRNGSSHELREFIELKGPKGLKLDGYVVVIVEGDGTTVSSTLDRAWDLKGSSMPTDGFFVLGNGGLPGVDKKIGTQNRIENGLSQAWGGSSSLLKPGNARVVCAPRGRRSL